MGVSTVTTPVPSSRWRTTTSFSVNPDGKVPTGTVTVTGTANVVPLGPNCTGSPTDWKPADVTSDPAVTEIVVGWVSPPGAMTTCALGTVASPVTLPPVLPTIAGETEADDDDETKLWCLPPPLHPAATAISEKLARVATAGRIHLVARMSLPPCRGLIQRAPGARRRLPR